MNKLRVFTSFTGIGSQEMALKNIGIDFEVVGISEVDRYAILGYDAIHNEQIEVENKTKEEMLQEFYDKNIAYNFSTGKSEIPRNIEDIKHLYNAHIRSKNYGDITKINENNLPDFDLFTYSYPCKNISVAGKQAGLVKGSGTQSALLWECERIIKVKKPKYLLMENVKNLVGKGHIDEFNNWINTLSDMGYNSYYKILNGKDYKVPQNRERVIMISILNNEKEYIFPSKIPLTISLKDILEETVDASFYMPKKRYKHIIENLLHQDISYCIDANYHKGASVDSFIEKKRRQLIQVGNLDNKTHANSRIYDEEGLSPTLNSMNGGNRQPKILRVGNESGNHFGGGFFDENGISPCLSASSGGGGGTNNIPKVVNDFYVRRLTPLECWRLMGFSDEDFYKAKNIGKLSNTKLYERAGRGIVVPMLEEIFKNLLD